ncbi:Serine endoprotease DegS [Vibrio stylophorae]|uniref:Serine endoprotease DegS n=1 Tax=Vibrio stylophorae TaxID=659351 RepID=A0ABM8ZQE7_9VIBR|nr:outer membrane-stress sensor serine endopeptidase DegS [Vibrio stylophorae]CAH0532511.1 Serine endoprotease DegS [Vibrio stylophorae]
MLQTLLRSVRLGLLVGVILVLALPQLRQQLLSQVRETIAPLEQGPRQSYHDAVLRAAPAVVNIYSRRYTNENSLELAVQGLGSGVIMNSQGYILTNLHVIAESDQVVVALQDGRIFMAQLIGQDALTDLAVLKIDADNLPVIPQDKQYQAQIGDVVLAIGNPYNLGQTTTFGIISATGRTGMSFGRQDFLQTDAAINQGNSGGALVNAKGNLVGINTASFQPTTEMDTYGISFAIPYTLADKIMDKIIADGRVIRGYVGILSAGAINPVMARVIDPQYLNGVMINKLEPGGPAELAGLRRHDIIVKIGEHWVQGPQDARDQVTELRPGTKVPFTVLREEQLLTLPITITEEPENGH